MSIAAEFAPSRIEWALIGLPPLFPSTQAAYKPTERGSQRLEDGRFASTVIANQDNDFGRGSVVFKERGFEGFKPPEIVKLKLGDLHVHCPELP